LEDLSIDGKYSEKDFREICTKMDTDLIEVDQKVVQLNVTYKRLLNFGFCKEIALPT
jgi:hypothetical protein